MDNKVKKKRNNSNKVIIILTSLFITSTIGSLTGTYAWFEYSARAKLQYHGTAISEHKILEIGLWSPVELPEAEKYNLYKDPVNPDIYWASNLLDSNMLTYYANKTGYASNKMGPSTSGEFIEGNEINLKSPPSFLENYSDSDLADTKDYVYLPLRFRARQGLSLGDGNQMIALSKINTSFSGNAFKGARIYFHSDTASFIFNPSSNENGFTTVSGPLDLNLDGFYDFKYPEANEFCYGEYELENIVYKENPTTNSNPMVEEERSCFNSAHANNVRAIDIEKSTFSHAYYFGLNDTLINKELTRLTPENRIASLDMKIFIEGWEENIIMENISNSFSIDLTFEVQEI